MVRMWAIFATLCTSVLFLVYRPGGEYKFPLGKYVMPVDTVVYLSYEHIGLIVIAIVLVQKYGFWFWITFLAIQLIDFALFLLYYRSPAFGTVPWNAAKIGFAGVPILYYTWKHLQAHYQK